MRTAILLLGVAGATLAWSADAGVTGPVSGFVVDGRYRVLRPIEGIPGAARIGAPLDLPFPIDQAAVAASQDYALLTAANSDGRPVLVRALRSGAPQITPIDRAIAASAIVTMPPSPVVSCLFA